MEEQKSLMLNFEGNPVRSTWYEGEQYFSVVDCVSILSESPTPRQYWGKMKDRDFKKLELSPIWVQLKLRASDGKLRETDCANTESMLRIVQSISSKKAEPFKRWLAKVGYERIEEIKNPELAIKRGQELYEKRGYSSSWISRRLQNIDIRKKLTDQWKIRYIKGKDYAILTNQIYLGAFGLTGGQYKQHKNLGGKDNLRDHMTDIELALTSLGEAVTTKVTIKRDAKGFIECKKSAVDGGEVAGKARKLAEQKIGESVVSNDNFLGEPEKVKRISKTKKHLPFFT